MKLFCTPLSHFSRKVRIVADFYNLDLEYIDVGAVTQIGADNFAGNPLMGVPVLQDDEGIILDSDYIISYLVNRYDPSDQLGFHTKSRLDLNIRAVLNGLMSNHVKLVIGKRTGLPTESALYFQKAKQSIEESLRWLERKINFDSDKKISFQEIHFISAVSHIKYFETINLNEFKKIREMEGALSLIPFIQKSDPFILKPKQ